MLSALFKGIHRTNLRAAMPARNRRPNFSQMSPASCGKSHALAVAPPRVLTSCTRAGRAGSSLASCPTRAPSGASARSDTPARPLTRSRARAVSQTHAARARSNRRTARLPQRPPTRHTYPKVRHSPTPPRPAPPRPIPLPPSSPRARRAGAGEELPAASKELFSVRFHTHEQALFGARPATFPTPFPPPLPPFCPNSLRWTGPWAVIAAR